MGCQYPAGTFVECVDCGAASRYPRCLMRFYRSYAANGPEHECPNCRFLGAQYRDSHKQEHIERYERYRNADHAEHHTDPTDDSPHNDQRDFHHDSFWVWNKQIWHALKIRREGFWSCMGNHHRVVVTSVVKTTVRCCDRENGKSNALPVSSHSLFALQDALRPAWCRVESA